MTAVHKYCVGSRKSLIKATEHHTTNFYKGAVKSGLSECKHPLQLPVSMPIIMYLCKYQETYKTL